MISPQSSFEKKKKKKQVRRLGKEGKECCRKGRKRQG